MSEDGAKLFLLDDVIEKLGAVSIVASPLPRTRTHVHHPPQRLAMSSSARGSSRPVAASDAVRKKKKKKKVRIYKLLITKKRKNCLPVVGGKEAIAMDDVINCVRVKTRFTASDDVALHVAFALDGVPRAPSSIDELEPKSKKKEWVRGCSSSSSSLSLSLRKTSK